MTLTQALAEAGINKTELAERLGVSRQTIHRMGEDITPQVQTLLNSLKEPPYTWQDIPIKEFDGLGRGTPKKIDGKSYVMVSKGWIRVDGELQTEQGVLTEKDWLARLDYACKHGREGWSCKVCLRK